MDDFKASRELGNKWLGRIRTAQKRDDAWIKNAEEAEKAYSVDPKGNGKVYDFNILHSNVETIVPAVFNSTPVPDIRDRFRDGDEVAKSVADVFERVISTQIDDNRLDAEIEAAAQDAFLAGRGIVRIRFDADVQEVPGEAYRDEITGDLIEGEPQQVVTGETVAFEVVSWRDYVEGPAKRFEDVQWVAFQHLIPEESLAEIEDEDMIVAQKEATDAPAVGDEEEDDIVVWEIWNKGAKEVLFIKELDGTIINRKEDPLGLEGFFPISKPVQPITLSGKRTPICPFTVYKRLADELDRTTKRINAITDGLKVRGWVVGSAEDVAQLADAGDNELVPISGFEGLAATGGIDKAIVWWPIDKAIQVLRELYTSREQTKQSIYEITGISDIVRGASKAQETLGAQEIKSQWGSLRIKKLQRLIERQVRDLFVMSTELISSRFSVETMQEMTGTQITPEMEQLIKDPLQRYRVDVESDSTIRADMSRVKGELSELLQGTAQYFSTMGPLIEQAPEMAEPAADIYACFARLFNLGQQGEAAIEKMVQLGKGAAQQPKPNPGAAEAEAIMQAEQAKLDIEIKSRKADFQLRQQEAESRQAMDAQKMQLEIAKSEIDREIKQVELQIKERELGIKERQQQIDTVAKVAEIQIEQTQQRAAKVG